MLSTQLKMKASDEMLIKTFKTMDLMIEGHSILESKLEETEKVNQELVQTMDLMIEGHTILENKF